MWTRALKRFAGAVLLVLAATVVCFALMHAAPGGPEAVLASNPRVSPEDIERLRRAFGLDQPVVIQYCKWLARAIQGDFGYSYATGEPVARMIAARLPATLQLMASALVFGGLTALTAGTLAALRRDSRTDTAVVFASLLVLSVPVFWAGLVAIMIFSVNLGLLPAAGMTTVGADGGIVDRLRHLVLPTLVLGLAMSATWVRHVRQAVSDVVDADYVRTARAKGVAGVPLLAKHVARNAAVPIVTVILVQVPALFTGAVVVETVFAWPGMGRLFYEGLQRFDYTRVMAILLVSSTLVVTTNLLTDLLYGVIDPRIRHANKNA